MKETKEYQCSKCSATTTEDIEDLPYNPNNSYGKTKTGRVIRVGWSSYINNNGRVNYCLRCRNK